MSKLSPDLPSGVSPDNSESINTLADANTKTSLNQTDDSQTTTTSIKTPNKTKYGLGGNSLSRGGNKECEETKRIPVRSTGSTPSAPGNSFVESWVTSVQLATGSASQGKCIVTSETFAAQLKQLNAKLVPAGYGPSCSLSRDKAELQTALSTMMNINAEMISNLQQAESRQNTASTDSQAEATTDANSTFDLSNPNRNTGGMAEPQPNTVYGNAKIPDYRSLLEEKIRQHREGGDDPTGHEPRIKDKQKQEDKDPKRFRLPSLTGIFRQQEEIYFCGHIVPDLIRKDTSDPIDKRLKISGTQDSKSPKSAQPEDFYFPSPSYTSYDPSHQIGKSTACTVCMIVGNKTATRKDIDKIHHGRRHPDPNTLKDSPSDGLTDEEISSTPVESEIDTDAPYIYGKMWVHGRLTKILNQFSNICRNQNLSTVEFKLASNHLEAIVGVQSVGVIIDDTILQNLTYTLENRPDGAYVVVSGFPTGYLTIDGKTSTMQFLVIQGDYKTFGIHKPQLMFHDTDFPVSGFSVSSSLGQVWAYSIDTSAPLGGKVTLAILDVQDSISELPSRLDITTIPLISKTDPAVDLSLPIIDSILTKAGQFFLLHANTTTAYLTHIDRYGRVQKHIIPFPFNTRIRNKAAFGREHIDIATKLPYHYNIKNPASTTPSHYLPFAAQTNIPAGMLFLGKQTHTQGLLFPTSYAFWGFEQFTQLYHPQNSLASKSLGVLYADGSYFAGQDIYRKPTLGHTTIVELIDNGRSFLITILQNVVSSNIGYQYSISNPSEPHDYVVDMFSAKLTTGTETHAFADIDIYMSQLYGTIFIMDKTKGIWIKRLRQDGELVYNAHLNTILQGSIQADKIDNAPLPICNHTFDQHQVGKDVFYISNNKHIIRVDTFTGEWKDFGVVDDSEDPIDITHPIWSSNGGRSSQRPEIWYKSVNGNLYRIRPYKTRIGTSLSKMVAEMLTDQDISHEILDDVYATYITGFGIKKDGRKEIGKLAKHFALITDLLIMNAGGTIYLVDKNNLPNIDSSLISTTSKTSTEHTTFSFDLSILDFRRRTRLKIATDEELFEGKLRPVDQARKQVITNISVDRYENITTGLSPIIQPTSIETSFQQGLKYFHRGKYNISLSSGVYKADNIANV